MVGALSARDASSGLIVAFLTRVLFGARDARRAGHFALTAMVLLLGNVSRGIAERLVRMYPMAFLLGLAALQQPAPAPVVQPADAVAPAACGCRSRTGSVDCRSKCAPWLVHHPFFALTALDGTSYPCQKRMARLGCRRESTRERFNPAPRGERARNTGRARRGARRNTTRLSMRRNRRTAARREVEATGIRERRDVPPPSYNRSGLGPVGLVVAGGEMVSSALWPRTTHFPLQSLMEITTSTPQTPSQ